MSKIAIIDKCPNKLNYKTYFNFDFDVFHLCDSNIKKVLKKDITLEFDASEYDFVILVGAETCKHIGKITSVIKYQGYLVDDKFIPITNPSMLSFKPEGKSAFETAVNNIHNYIEGKIKDNSNLNLHIIDDYTIAKKYLKNILGRVINKEIINIGVDSETTALYPRDGYVLGICLAPSESEGAYISADIIDDDLVLIFQQIFNKATSIFHNAKFDIKFLNYHFGFVFPHWEDTMLIHYCLNEQPGTHGLKELALKYTDLGDYDKELDTFKRQYCKDNKIKLADFTYDLIPFNILGEYGAIDPIATLKLFNLFFNKITKSSKLSNVYYSLLKPGTEFLIDVEENGVPFDIERLKEAERVLGLRIEQMENNLYNYKEVHIVEKHNGKIFNTNSVYHLRALLFDVLGLVGPGKLTDTGALSTDAEVLEELSKQHPVAKLILDIKKAKKIKSTYIDKIIPALDKDNRLRTGFNLTTTTSGRLSSSGKLNMQQLPRDDKTVKRCIKARKGYKIISQDLKTAEMYVVAAISGDKVLQDIFIQGADYHSMMAKMKYNLPYTWQEILKNHKDKRQEAKTVSFEILYKLNFNEPALKKFKRLRKWLEEQQSYILNNGFVYQFFGRKRRLPNAFSDKVSIKNHEVRSGVNSLVQGPSSDINLLAGIEMQQYIKENNMKTKIFGLVHDSILAEVPDDEMDNYCNKLAEITQKDRGLNIPNCPIGLDLEIGEDYSFKEAA